MLPRSRHPTLRARDRHRSRPSGYVRRINFNGTSLVDAVLLAADARSIPTQTAFRFLHGAASLEEQQPLDLYLRLPRATVDLDDDDMVASVASLTYQAASSYFIRKEGDYEICFAYAGASTIVMGPTPFHVANGQITTLLSLDAEDGSLERVPVTDAAD